ncbi:serine hydrolase [Rhizocola hellebori]|uniref:Serine hydrolase n=1 Tax=Rhizocola hellebori TaxID=1392758 RepID=A0A8J3VD42_9ACTN|nr:serine hydrolase [Rhizocola hellebori]GIH02365.1 serine hydrolase [Rhizocola hellebori]
MIDFSVPEQPSLSPDGGRCIYVVRSCDAAADRTVRRLWSVDTLDGKACQLTRGDADTSPAWSPQGTQIAFLRAGAGPAQLWLLPAGGGEPEQLTDLPLGAGGPVWSPDGKKIAFGAVVDMHAVHAHAPIVADRLDYQADGVGLLGGRRKHVHVLDLETRRLRQITSGDWHAGHPAWSPDSTTLAYAAATAPDADLNLSAPVYTVDITTETPVSRLAGLADGIAAAVTFTADGNALLVVGTTSGPVGHAHLLHLPLAGGEVVDLAEALDRNVMPGGPAYPGAWPQLADGGKSVLFCVRDRGCTHLYSVPVTGGRPHPIVATAGEVVSGVSVAGDTAAIVLSTPTSFGEIVTVDLRTGERTVRTEHSAPADLYARREVEFTISDGTVVHGWLMRDPATAGAQPLLLDVHGGPHNAWNGAADEIHRYHQELVALGWTVLLVNPRGSDGYGERFFNAALGAWGEADAKDFLEPLDQLVAQGIADPGRLAVTGYSYGGYMTCYLTSRDRRFAAAVAGGVVTDLVSMAGTSAEGHLLSRYELGGQPWSDPQRYLAMSPYSRVGEVSTPTLILHGAADLTCPVGQAQQWYTALRERQVPTRMVLYPDGDHPFILDGRPSHRIDYNRRVVEWMQQYADEAKPRIDIAHWQRRLAELAQRHEVPGAALGILRLRPGQDDELAEAAYGVLNMDTGVEVTPDSLFQIGSITKVWTATVAMLLADEGKLDLDAPIAEVLPELQLSDKDVAARVTMRHLLTHTSGIDGDVFTDTGRGDDCLEKYVAALAGVMQNHPLGVTWSYCNSGFSLAGRVIERLTGGTWDAAMKERLFTPLGLRHTVTLPEEALLFRTAVGHVTGPDAQAVRAPVWMLPRPLGPAGLICSTTADVLAFARLHLNSGATADGTQLLSPAGTEAMAALQAELPDKHTLGDSWGLGWIRDGWDGRRLIGHDGNTIGQAAFLRLLPEEGLAVTLLTNGGRSRDLYEELYREIFAELAGVQMPATLTPPAEPVTVDVQAHLGTYERHSVRLDVFEGEDGPMLRTTLSGEIAALLPDPVSEYPMVAVSDNLFVVREPQAQTWTPVTFYELPSGEKYLHFGVRATPKVS